MNFEINKLSVFNVTELFTNNSVVYLIVLDLKVYFVIRNRRAVDDYSISTVRYFNTSLLYFLYFQKKSAQNFLLK